MGNSEIFAEVRVREGDRQGFAMRGEGGAALAKVGVRPPEGAAASGLGRLDGHVHRALGRAEGPPHAPLQNTQGPRRPTLQE